LKKQAAAFASFLSWRERAGSVLVSLPMPVETLPEEEATPRAGSTAYREFLADREDLLRHKWLMSERAGRDVGLEAALFDWVDHHRATMRKQRTKQT
jgi:hypothetical protein